jgi:adenosine tuberculosinyltransferase
MNARRPPDLPEWLSWSTERVPGWISAQREPVVMGWPYNGTRRWYVTYRRRNPGAKDYLKVLIRRQAELHRLIFAHGVSVILAPSFGAETLKRGEAYTHYALGGLARLPDDEVYRALIDSGVRIRFYGDYREALAAAGLRSALQTCATLTEATGSAEGPLLLIELFADDPFPTLARLSVEFTEREGRPPDRAELIEAYYGVPVADLSLYVSFERPEMFDVPLLTTDLEHLYATLNPFPGSQRTSASRDPLRSSRNAAGSAGGLCCPHSKSIAGTGRARRELQRQHAGHRSHRPAYRPVETVATHAGDASRIGASESDEYPSTYGRRAVHLRATPRTA